MARQKVNSKKEYQTEKYMTLSSSKPGDLIQHSDGSLCMVLFKLGDCIGRSKCYNYASFHCIETITEMEKAGFTPLYKGQKTMKKVEAEKLLGLKIIE